MIILRIIFDFLCLASFIFGLGAVLLGMYADTLNPEDKNLDEFDKTLIDIFR